MARFGMDLTKGPVLKRLVVFAVPLFLSSLLQQLYNACDMVVVGQLVSDTALAAVGATGALTNLILNIFIGLSTGANVVCAKAKGAGDREGVERVVHTAILLGFLSGVILLFIGVFGARSFLGMMGTPSDVIDLSTRYMRLYFLGAPFSLCYNFGASILQSGGDTKRPLYILSVSGIANVLLNLFCVTVLHLGVEGVAIGTIASQAISALIVLFILCRAEDEYHLSLKKLRLHPKTLLEIARVGIPTGLNSMVFSISNIMVQSTINSFGKIAMAGNTAATNIDNINFFLLNSVATASVSFTAQNVGAKKLDRVDQVAWKGTLLASVSSLVCGLFFLVTGKYILAVFNSNPEVISYGLLRNATVGMMYWIYAPSQVFIMCQRGMGFSTLPAILNAVFVCGTRLLWIFFAFPLHPTMMMLYYCYPISWGLSSVSQVISYFYARKKLRAERISA